MKTPRLLLLLLLAGTVPERAAAVESTDSLVLTENALRDDHADVRDARFALNRGGLQVDEVRAELKRRRRAAKDPVERERADRLLRRLDPGRGRE